MEFLMSIKRTFKLYSAALEECIIKAMGFVNNDGTIDWLGYYHYEKEQMLSKNKMRQSVFTFEVKNLDTIAERIAQNLSDIKARLKALWLKRLHEDSRASQSEGRFISLMASMPVPPTKPAIVSGNRWSTDYF